MFNVFGFGFGSVLLVVLGGEGILIWAGCAWLGFGRVLLLS